MKTIKSGNQQLPFEASLISHHKTSHHTSNVIEIFFLLEGSLTVKTKDEDHKLLESDILILRMSPYQLISQGDNLLLQIKVNPYAIPPISNLPENLLITQQSSEKYEKIKSCLSNFSCLYFADDSDKTLAMYSLIYKLFDLICNQKLLDGSTVIRNMSDNDQRLQAIESYIHQNFRTGVSLNEVAGYFYLTPQYMSRFFKQNLGVNFVDYLNNIRLSSAVDEMLDTDETITKIAFNSGFPNLAAFNRVFVEKYSISPHKYRAQAALAETPADSGQVMSVVDFDQVRNQLSSFICDLDDDIKHVENLEIEADVLKSTYFEHTWQKVVNLGYAADLIKSDFRKQVEMFQGEMKFTYARIQGIFSEEVPVNVSGASYNFSYTDKIIDYLYTVGLLPFIEISDKPKMFNQNPASPVLFENNYRFNPSMAKMKTVFASFIIHCVNRYGSSEVGKWKFELWAEHNEETGYLEEKIAEYIDMFQFIYQTVKNLIPNAQVGGPGYNFVSGLDSFKAIISSLKNRSITPDFVSFYVFPYTMANDSQSEAFIWGKNDFFEKIETIKNLALACNPLIKSFFITEWNFDFVNRNILHDTCFKAPFILKNIIDNFSGLDGMAYWLLSDISDEYIDTDNILFGGSGLLSRNNIRKPAYYAYAFLSKLGSSLIGKGDGYIITSRSDHEYEVLIFNYKYLNDYQRLNIFRTIDIQNIDAVFEDTDDLDVVVRLNNVRAGKYRIKKYVLNQEHGSILDEWIRLNAFDNIQQSEIDYLDKISMPSIYIDSLDCLNELVLKSRLKANEVNLYTISSVL